MVVQVAEIFAQVIDGNTGDAEGSFGSRFAIVVRRWGRGFEVGDAFAEDADEVTHDVGDGVANSEEEGVEIPFGDAVAELAGEAGVQLIFRDGVEDGAVLVGFGCLGVEGHIDGLRGDVHFVDLFPRPFEIRTSRRNDTEDGRIVTFAFFGGEGLGNGVIENGIRPDAFGATEGSFHRAFVLIDGVKPGEEVAQEKPGDEPADNSEDDGYLELNWMTELT